MLQQRQKGTTRQIQKRPGVWARLVGRSPPYCRANPPWQGLARAAVGCTWPFLGLFLPCLFGLALAPFRPRLGLPWPCLSRPFLAFSRPCLALPLPSLFEDVLSMILGRFLGCFSRRFLTRLGKASSKRDPTITPPLPMKSEIGHFTISDKNIRFIFKNIVENQVSFSILFLMILGWFWEGFWEYFGYRKHFKNILIFSIVFKAVF